MQVAPPASLAFGVAVMGALAIRLRQADTQIRVLGET
jgi:hypothetical protein